MHARKSIVLSFLVAIALAVWPSLRELATNLTIETKALATVAESGGTTDSVATAVFAVG